MTRKLAWIATSIVATAIAILTSYIFVIYRPSTDPSQICKYQDTKVYNVDFKNSSMGRRFDLHTGAIYDYFNV